jgi:hypothetical protein
VRYTVNGAKVALNTFIVFFTGYVIVVAAILSGWVMNVLDLVYWTDPQSALLVLKVIGVVLVPLGGLLGWVS